MKKNFLALAAACLIAALGAGSAQAQELDKNATEAEIAAFEKEHFITFDAMSVNGDAKAAQALISATGEGAEGSDAKCWFWGWRYYYYPTYYYYTWYCPCYYVPLRLVTYTVPVTTTTTTVVTTPGAAANVEVQQQQVQQPQQQQQQQNQQQQQQQQQTQDQSAAQSNSVDPNTVAIAKSTGRMACGAVVDQTVPQNSPLKKMGVKVGDVITHVDGVQVKSLHDLKKITANSKLTVIPGSSISVSKQQINHAPSAKASQDLENGAKGDLTELNIGEDSIGENETVSLYEYYEALEGKAK